MYLHLIRTNQPKGTIRTIGTYLPTITWYVLTYGPCMLRMHWAGFCPLMGQRPISEALNPSRTEL